METIVKQAREVGTSAGVLLPRSWLDKQVVVTLFSPSKEEIAKDIMEILVKKDLNEGVKGIYLFGSYARGEQDSESDIDVLIITQKINKLINYGNYEIMLVSEENFSKNLASNLSYLSIMKEIKVVMNRELIEKYSLKKQKLNLRKLLIEIEKIIKINKEMVELCRERNKKIPDGMIYSIVLRLRELYLIKCLISNKKYYKKDFIKIVGEKIHLAYSRVKKDEKELEDVFPDEAKKLLDLSEKWLKEIKK